MNEQSGRSLIEIVGVMAIAGIMAAGVIATYNTVRNRQTRVIAAAQMEQIVKNAKLLMDARRSFDGISVDYLVKAGAIKTNRAPIGSNEWSITPNIDGKEFLINLKDLSKGDCDYFTTVNLSWVSQIRVNGYESDPGTYCLTTGGNDVSFIVQ